MPLGFKDYYAVMGVPRDASTSDIRKAFRKLAHKLHPDVAADKTTAEAAFKELNEANQVLSDPEKRRTYDQLAADEQSRARDSWPGRRPDGRAREEAPEFHFEGTGYSDFFEALFGARRQPGRSFDPSRRNGGPAASIAQPGGDIESDILVTLEEVLHGATRTLTLQRTDPRTGLASTQTLRVKIPAGVQEGRLIRLAGQGQAGVGGGEPGHLYLRVMLAQHADLRVEGADLYYELDLAPWEAVLGTSVVIPTLDGKVSLRVPPGTAAEQHLRLQGLGLPAEGGGRGHLYAVVSIRVPVRTTPDEQALWKALAAKSTFEPRRAA